MSELAADSHPGVEEDRAKTNPVYPVSVASAATAIQPVQPDGPAAVATLQNRQPVGEKLEWAMDQLEILQELIQRTDAKAQFILAAGAVLLSVVVALFADIQALLFGAVWPVNLAFGVVLGGFFTATLASLLAGILVVNPRFRKQNPLATVRRAPPLLFYREIARSYDGSAAYSAALSDASLEDLLDQAAATIFDLSVVADRKYELYRTASRWLVVSVLVWFAVLIVLLVLG